MSVEEHIRSIIQSLIMHTLTYRLK